MAIMPKNCYNMYMARLFRHKNYLVLTTAVILLAAGTIFYFARDSSFYRLPPAQPYQASPSPKPTVKTTPAQPTKSPAPEAINLDIPFTSQAPHRIWDLPYEEFCEEASVLMAASYLKGEKIPDADYANEKLLAIKAFEEKRFGYYEDTTAEETAVILREFYGIEKVKVVASPSVADIREALAQGKAVIVPAAGRLLGNPYFQTPGPVYHMLVIKGYTKDGNFITNDPGTRRGENFIYTPDVLMNAIHDWDPADINSGRKVMIVAG